MKRRSPDASFPSLRCTPSTCSLHCLILLLDRLEKHLAMPKTLQQHQDQGQTDSSRQSHLKSSSTDHFNCYFTPVHVPGHWSQMGQARVQEQVGVCDIIRVKPLPELEWAKFLQTLKSWVLFIVPSTVIVVNLVIDTHACIDPANIYEYSTFFKY